MLSAFLHRSAAGPDLTMAWRSDTASTLLGALRADATTRPAREADLLALVRHLDSRYGPEPFTSSR